MNTKILLNERPVGEPKLGNFRTVREDIVSPKEGEVLLKTIYMSLDPYMRGRMNDAKSYAKPVGIGEVMEAGALSQVVESKSELFKAGDFVEGRTGWQDNPTVNEKKLRLIDPKMAPLSISFVVLGMPGTTAYFGMHNFAKPQKGVVLTYNGGQPCGGRGQRSVSYHMVCANNFLSSEPPAFAYESPTCHYHVVWPTMHACPRSTTGPRFMHIILSLIIIYFVLRTAYNKFLLGIGGFEAIPHLGKIQSCCNFFLLLLK